MRVNIGLAGERAGGGRRKAERAGEAAEKPRRSYGKRARLRWRFMVRDAFSGRVEELFRKRVVILR